MTKDEKALFLRGSISILYLVLPIQLYLVVITLQSVSDLYLNAQYTQGTVTGTERTSHGNYGPRTYTIDHTVVSIDGTMQWVFERSEMKQQIPDGTKLDILYSSKKPQKVRIWEPEYITDGKPSIMRLIQEEDWLLHLVLFPVMLVILFVLLMKARHMPTMREVLRDMKDTVKN